MPPNTDYAHNEPLYVISVKYKLSLPDDGSYVIRSTLEYILMCVF